MLTPRLHTIAPALFLLAPTWIPGAQDGDGAGSQDDAHADEHVAGPAEPLHLVFGWPEAGSVRMEVEITRSTGAGRYACGLSWAPDPDFEGGEGEAPDRIVHYRDFEFLELNGKQPGDRGFDGLTQVLAPALAALPPFRVAANGEFLGLIDLDDAVEGLAESLESLAPGTRGTLEKMLADPMMRGALENSVAEDWSWWASFWNDYETTAGETVSSEVSFPSGVTGKPIGAELTMECVDVHERDGVPAVHMRAFTSYDPDDMLRVTMATLRRMSEAPVPDDAILAVSRLDEIDGVYTVDGLRPLEVHWSKTIAVDDGSGPQESVERKSWTFDWSE